MIKLFRVNKVCFYLAKIGELFTYLLNFSNCSKIWYTTRDFFSFSLKLGLGISPDLSSECWRSNKKIKVVETVLKTTYIKKLHFVKTT